jgi:c(7)-type cytochrome triheme protein
MRMKTIALLVAVAFICTLGVALAAAPKPPQTVVLKGPTKPAVDFNHKKHAETLKIACTECHHKYVNGKNVWKQGKPMGLKEALHKNCIDCHKKEKAAGKKAPTMCNECHKK